MSFAFLVFYLFLNDLSLKDSANPPMVTVFKSCSPQCHQVKKKDFILITIEKIIYDIALAYKECKVRIPSHMCKFHVHGNSKDLHNPHCEIVTALLDIYGDDRL